MTSTWLMVILIIEYAAIALAAAVERNWYRALYYSGAIAISFAVLGMTNKGKGI